MLILRYILERRVGLEPTTLAWKAKVLPDKLSSLVCHILAQSRHYLTRKFRSRQYCVAIKLHKLHDSFVKVRLRLSVRIQQMLHLNRIFLIKQRNVYSINAIIALRRFVVRRLSVVSLAGCASSHSVCYYCYRLMLGAVTVSAICRRPCIQGEHRRLGFTQRFTRRSIEVLYVWVERRLKTQWAHQEVKELE